MRKLWAHYSLQLGLVLLIATVLPMLVLYWLSESGLVEASYIVDTRRMEEIRSVLENMPSIPDVPVRPDITSRVSFYAPEQLLAVDPVEGVVPVIIYEPELGRWRLNGNSTNIILISSIFHFRMELPAWIAVGALPAASLVIGVLLSIWMSRSVTRPVAQLALAAKAIGRRDLGCRVEAQGSQELQDLAQSFNRMAEDLERAETIRRNLMADVAHELRTPLAVLDGNLRAILDGVHTLDEEEIALLYEQTRHLNRLVEDLRELSLAEADQLSLDLREVDLVRLVKETAAHFDLATREGGVQLTTELNEPLPPLRLDENRMRQVLHNLLANAFRHTPRGGRISITANHLPEEDVLEIAVTDTGAGIPPEELPHIFDRFYRANGTAGRDRGGTGLGLAIVKAIVEAHAGRVSAASAGRDQGSTFSMALPAALTG